MDLRSPALDTKHGGALTRKDQMRPFLAVSALRQWHDVLPYLPDILFVS